LNNLALHEHIEQVLGVDLIFIEINSRLGGLLEEIFSVLA
jgi:hypothetical protein